MDDGTVARLDDDTFYVTTTSTGADGVYQWFTWWNAVWFMDVQFANLTGALAAINVAGPNAREAMERVSDDDFSNEGFAYLDAKHVTVAGVPTLALRIGFVGELGYELTSRARTPSTCGTRSSSRPPTSTRSRSGSSRSGSSASRRAT